MHDVINEMSHYAVIFLTASGTVTKLIKQALVSFCTPHITFVLKYKGVVNIHL